MLETQFLETVSFVTKEWPIHLTYNKNVLGLGITNGEGTLITMKNASN